MPDCPHIGQKYTVVREEESFRPGVIHNVKVTVCRICEEVTGDGEVSGAIIGTHAKKKLSDFETDEEDTYGTGGKWRYW